MRAAELQAASTNCGLGASSSKDVLARNLLLKRWPDLENPRSRPIEPKRVLSFDLGLRNFAYALVNEAMQVEQWARISLELPEVYHPIAYGDRLRRFIESAPFARYLVEDPAETIVVIERQRHRSGGFVKTPETIMRIGYIEIQLHSLLLGRTEAILPAQTAKYFGLPEGCLKKSAAIALADTWLSSDMARQNCSMAPVQCPQFLVDRFRGESKRDDMADCLLQAVAYLQWRQNCTQFFSDHGIRREKAAK